MNHTIMRGIGVSAATFALVLLGYTAQAQQKAPAPAAPSAAAPAAPAAAAKKPEKKPASACQGLDQAACTAKADECTWVAASKTKAGKEIKAYCRSKPKTAAKTTPPAAAATPKAAPPATPPKK